jgi:hypothetical protein
VLALGLSEDELECLHGDDVSGTDLRSPGKYEPRYPSPIDVTKEDECDAERESIFKALHRKRVLQGLQEKVDHLEKRRNREPHQLQLPRKVILTLDSAHCRHEQQVPKTDQGKEEIKKGCSEKNVEHRLAKN